MRSNREWIILDSLDDHCVNFPDSSTWQLRRKLSEKPWEGSETHEKPTWSPSEAHAVYECVQVRGPYLGSVAIVKVRIEVPYDLPPRCDPSERAKHASGMRLNGYTKQEIESLEILSAANCSSAPRLLGVKVDVQDESILSAKEGTEFFREFGDVKFWMPGGYVVYILMTKLPGQSLEEFWNPKLYSAQDRHNIRLAFRKAFLEIQKLGIQFMDQSLQNIMWDKKSQRCYLIDFEDTEYCPDYPDPDGFYDSDYRLWQLARKWDEPEW